MQEVSQPPLTYYSCHFSIFTSSHSTSKLFMTWENFHTCLNCEIFDFCLQFPRPRPSLAQRMAGVCGAGIASSAYAPSQLVPFSNAGPNAGWKLAMQNVFERDERTWISNQDIPLYSSSFTLFVSGKNSAICTPDSSLEDPNKMPKACHKRLVTIFLRLWHGKTITLEVEDSSTVMEIKQQVLIREAIPINLQELSAAGRVLQGNKTLKELQIADGDSMWLSPRLVGGSDRFKSLQEQFESKWKQIEGYASSTSIPQLRGACGVFKPSEDEWKKIKGQEDAMKFAQDKFENVVDAYFSDKLCLHVIFKSQEDLQEAMNSSQSPDKEARLRRCWNRLKNYSCVHKPEEVPLLVSLTIHNTGRVTNMSQLLKDVESSLRESCPNALVDHIHPGFSKFSATKVQVWAHDVESTNAIIEAETKLKVGHFSVSVDTPNCPQLRKCRACRDRGHAIEDCKMAKALYVCLPTSSPCDKIGLEVIKECFSKANAEPKITIGINSSCNAPRWCVLARFDSVEQWVECGEQVLEILKANNVLRSHPTFWSFSDLPNLCQECGDAEHRSRGVWVCQQQLRTYSDQLQQAMSNAPHQTGVLESKAQEKRASMPPTKIQPAQSIGCVFWAVRGNCRFGDNCRESHKPKQKKQFSHYCLNFLLHGQCNFEGKNGRCRFRHAHKNQPLIPRTSQGDRPTGDSKQSGMAAPNANKAKKMVEINPGHGNQRGDGKEPEKNDGLSAPVDTNSPLRPRHTKKVRAEHLQENQPVSQPFTLANPMAEPVINTVPFSTSSTSSGSSAESKRKDKKRTHEGQSVSELSFFEVSDSSIPPGPFSGASSASSASRVQPVDQKMRKTRKSASNKKKKSSIRAWIMPVPGRRVFGSTQMQMQGQV